MRKIKMFNKKNSLNFLLTLFCTTCIIVISSLTPYPLAAQSSALVQGIDFVVAKTNLINASPFVDTDGNLIAAHSDENGFNMQQFFDYVYDENGDYFEYDSKFYSIEEMSYTLVDTGFFVKYENAFHPFTTDDRCNANGDDDSSGNFVKLHIDEIDRIIPLYNNRFEKLDEGTVEVLGELIEIDNNNRYQKQDEFFYPIYNHDGEDYSEYNYELKAKTDDGTKAFLPTYFAADDLNNLFLEDENIDGEKEKLFSTVYENHAKNTAINNNFAFVQLDNYAESLGIENGSTPATNIETLYMSFGDILQPSVNDETNGMNRVLSSLDVTVKLSNKYYPSDYYSSGGEGGIFIAINSPVVQDTKSFHGTPVTNHFWYDFIDLSNLEYYNSQDRNENSKLPVVYSDGLYTFTFKYNHTYYDSALKQLVTSPEMTFTYSLYLSSSTDYQDYPDFTTSLDAMDESKVPQLDYLTYYYNFQTDSHPTYAYDASKYSVNYTFNYNHLSVPYSSQFRTIQRNDLSDNLITETAVLDEYAYGNTFDKIISRTRISAKLEIDDTVEPYAAVYKYTYNYRIKTSGIAQRDYLNTVFGTFAFKLSTHIYVTEEVDGNKTTTTYFIYHYKSTAPEHETNTEVGDLIEFERLEIINEKTTLDLSSLPTGEHEVSFDTAFTSTYHNIKGDKDGLIFTTLSPETILSNDFSAITSTKYVSQETTLLFDIRVINIDSNSEVFHSNFVGFSIEESEVSVDGVEILNPTEEDITFNTASIMETQNHTKGKNIFAFNWFVEFSELGTYSITNSHSISGVNVPNTINSGYNSVNSENFVSTFTSPKNIKKNYEHIYRYNGFNLHVFGVKAYFNKNGKTELKNEETQTYSEFTSMLKASGVTITDLTSGLSFVGSGSGGTPKQKVPLTNMTPVTFDYYSQYSTNTNVPLSRIYRYNYTYDSQGNIEVGSLVRTSYFDQDTAPKETGYYEVVIRYTYSGYKDNTKEFYQVFAFAINNSPPQISVQKQTEVVVDSDTVYKRWTSIDDNIYTNSPVRITWNTTTYFQYDILPYVSKTNYDGVSVGVNASPNYASTVENTSGETEKIFTFKASDGEDIAPKAGEAGNLQNIVYYTHTNSKNLVKVPKIRVYSNSIDLFNRMLYPSDFENTNLVKQIEENENITYEVEGYAYQLIITATNNSGSYWGSGVYGIQIYYGSAGNQFVSLSFIIDTVDIAGNEIKLVDISATTKKISNNVFKNNTKNLINEPFTYIYNKKSSGAAITTKYVTLPFNASIDEAIELLLAGKNSNNANLTAITTSHFVNGQDDFNVDKPFVNDYIYNHTYNEVGDAVSLNNVFPINTSESTLYVFYSTDNAGNTKQYFVIYDKTTPNYFVDSDDEIISDYNIITDTTRLNWGNYKAVEIVDDKDNSKTIIDEEYIYGSKVNHRPSPLNMLLKQVYLQPSSYSGALLKRFVQLAETGTFVELKTYTNADIFNDAYARHNLQISDIGKPAYYIESGKYYLTENDKELTLLDETPLTKHYLLLPISEVSFKYRNTNSTDNNEYYHIFTPMTDNTQTGTILAQSLVSLARIVADVPEDTPASDSRIVAAQQLILANPGKYGFYGEKIYDYNIIDQLFNMTEDSLWMNLDISQGLAFGNFINTSNTLTSTNNLGVRNLTPNSVYSSSQLYFSYLQQQSVAYPIPETEVSYKYYTFDPSFYDNYEVHSIQRLSDGNYEIKYTFGDKTITQIIDNKNYDNYNLDGEVVSEPKATFPFSLNATTTEWESLPLSFSKTEGNYQRSYSNLINQEQRGAYTYTREGLYVFKRVYTDYLNADGTVNLVAKENLEKDTVIRFYAFYVDRNSIIDMSESIGQDILFALGMGVAEEDYATNLDARYINNNINQNNNTFSYKQQEGNNLFTTNKTLLQLTVPMDKYSQKFVYLKFMNKLTNAEKANIIVNSSIAYTNKTNIEEMTADAVAKFVSIISTHTFGLTDARVASNQLDNQLFLIKLNLSFGNSVVIGSLGNRYNLIDPYRNTSYQYLVNNLTAKQKLSSSSVNADRSTLLDQILLYNTAFYSLTLVDNAGVDSSGTFANSLKLSFGINRAYPTGSYLGKDLSSEYATNAANAKQAYATSLFENGDLEIMANLGGGKYEDKNQKNLFVYKSTNNSSLIFVFEKPLTNLEAEVNPYEITITKMPETSAVATTIFRATIQNIAGKMEYTFQHRGGAVVTTSNVFLDNAHETDGVATKWAVIIFDNASSIYNDTTTNALSTSKENATYNITIQFKGQSSFYTDSAAKSVSYFHSTSSITTDHTKPIYNLIKLMEADKYNSKRNIALPSGYQYLQEYANSLAGTPLYKQYMLNEVYKKYFAYYDKYMETENTLIQNHFFAVDNTFKFTKALTETANSDNENRSHTSLDTYSQLYLRRISDITNYYHSLTPDDYQSTPAHMSNHKLFSPSIATRLSTANRTDENFHYIDYLQDLTVGNTLLQEGNYYEIIERDEAGNYQVYCIFITASNSYSYSYSDAYGRLKTEDFKDNLSSENEIVANAYGMNLLLSNKDNQPSTQDLYLKAEITYTFRRLGQNYTNSANPIVVANNALNRTITINKNGSTLDIFAPSTPIENNIDGEEVQTFFNTLKQIYDSITESYEGANDFAISIKIINRVGKNFVVNYFVPGDVLKYEKIDISGAFRIRIPADNEYTSTKIVSLKVQRFRENQWEDLNLDANNTPLPTTSNVSLGGKTFTFRNGAFRFTLIDNFGRTNVYYERHGMENIESALYYTDATSSVDGTTYTAKATYLEYDASVFEAYVFVTIGTQTYRLVQEGTRLVLTGDNAGITSASTGILNVVKSTYTRNNTLVTKINITLANNNELNIKALLIETQTLPTAYYDGILSDYNTIYFKEFNFVYFTKIPSLNLRNSSGGTIAYQENQTFIDNLSVLWQRLPLVPYFNERLVIVRTFDGRQYREISYNNYYEIKDAGDYTVTLVNDLNHSSQTLRFKRSAETTIIYSIYLKTLQNKLIVNKLPHSTHTTLASNNKDIVNHYYVLEKYNNYETKNGVISPVITGNHIEVVTNTNNSIGYEIVVEPDAIVDATGLYVLYRIYNMNSPDYTYNYILINFVEETNANFAGLNIDNIFTNDLITNSMIKSTDDMLSLKFKNTYNSVVGNDIYLEYLLDNIFIEKVKLGMLPKDSANNFVYSISKAGLHTFIVYDMAGNKMFFDGAPELKIYLVNEIIFKINNTFPVDNQIFNDPVDLEIIYQLSNVTIYSECTIQVLKNGTQISVNEHRLNTYQFIEAGHYKVSLQAITTLSDGQNMLVNSVFYFQIISPESAASAFDISSGNNFKITKLERKISPQSTSSFASLAIKDENQLWLSAANPETYGAGLYRITLQSYQASTKSIITFTFIVWVNDEQPSITASIPMGTAATDPITIYYNPWSIYLKLGNSKIVLNNRVLLEINKNSADTVVSFTLEKKGDNWIEIFTADDKLVASYKLIQNEPLNSNAIIIIVIVGTVVAVGIIFFIILRRRVRFK